MTDQITVSTLIRLNQNNPTVILLEKKKRVTSMTDQITVSNAILKCCGAVVLRCCSAVVLQCCDVAVLRCCSAVLFQHCNAQINDCKCIASSWKDCLLSKMLMHNPLVWFFKKVDDVIFEQSLFYEQLFTSTVYRCLYFYF